MRRFIVVSLTVLLLVASGFAFAGGAREADDTVTIQIGLAPREVGQTFPALLDEFRAANPNIRVNWLEVPGVPGEQKNLYVTNLIGRSDEPDIMALDIIWPGEFIANGWTTPLNDYFSAAELGQFNPALIDAATTPNGEVHAIPFYQNAVHFFYRRDLLEKYDLEVPTTWSELEDSARVVLQGENDPDLAGYTSMWAQIEGLFMNYLQFLWGAGGSMVNAQGRVAVDTPQGRQALNQMVGMLERNTAPESILTYRPNDAMALFRQGRAVFMVVQGFVWPIITEPDSPVADVVEMGSIPVFDGQDPETTRRHAIGAWMFAINPNSRNVDAAVQLIRFLTREENQVRLGIETGNLPPRLGMENNPALIEAVPIAVQQFRNFALGDVRPSVQTGENYTEFSDIMQRHIHAALTGDMTVEQALRSAQSEANTLLGQ